MGPFLFLGLSVFVDLNTESREGNPMRINGFLTSALIALGVVVAYEKFGKSLTGGMRIGS